MLLWVRIVGNVQKGGKAPTGTINQVLSGLRALFPYYLHLSVSLYFYYV